MTAAREEVDRHWGETLDSISKDTGLPRWRIEEEFGYGACAQLALAVGEYRGLPLAIVKGEHGYLHAFCVIADGLALDIWGVRSFGEVLSVWQEDEPGCLLEPISQADLLAMGGREASPAFSEIPGTLARDGCLAGVVLDEFTLTEFNCGACGDFATVLHDRTGWKLMAERDGSGDVEHIWVVDDDGYAIDINGKHPDGRAVTPYSSEKAGRIAPISRQEAVSQGRHGVEYREWAQALVARYPERFGFSTSAIEEAVKVSGAAQKP